MDRFWCNRCRNRSFRDISLIVSYSQIGKAQPPKGSSGCRSSGVCICSCHTVALRCLRSRRVHGGVAPQTEAWKPFWPAGSGRAGRKTLLLFLFGLHCHGVLFFSYSSGVAPCCHASHAAVQRPGVGALVLGLFFDTGAPLSAPTGAASPTARTTSTNDYGEFARSPTFSPSLSPCGTHRSLH